MNKNDSFASSNYMNINENSLGIIFFCMSTPKQAFRGDYILSLLWFDLDF